MKWVTLTWEECRFAAMVGVERELSALRNGRCEPYGGPDRVQSWGTDIFGAAGELALAKARDSYWAALAERPHELDGDVGKAQVRWTWREHGHLLIHPPDPDDAPFVLCVGTMPRMGLAGWLWGHECKQERWWREDTGRPAFFVPQSALREIP